jgi:hypothetical protein
MDMLPLTIGYYLEGNVVFFEIVFRDGAQSYRLYLNGQLVYSSNTNSFGYILDNYGTYSFSLTAVDVNGNETDIFGPVIVDYQPEIIDESSFTLLVDDLDGQISELSSRYKRIVNSFVPTTGMEQRNMMFESKLAELKTLLNDLKTRTYILNK